MRASGQFFHERRAPPANPARKGHPFLDSLISGRVAVSPLVPPHNSEQVKPLLLLETERAEERKRAEKFRKIPLDSITLSVNKDLADSLYAEEKVTLINAETSEILAVMEIHEKYSIDKQLEAEHVYRTADPKHPGVAK